jgi:hypothetical protein
MQRWPHRVPAKRAPSGNGPLATAAGILRARAGERAELADDLEMVGRSWLAHADALEHPRPPPAGHRRHRKGGRRH